MAVVTVTGEPGCRADESARLVAQRLGFDLVTESELRRLVVEEFGSETALPDRVYPVALTAMLARLACKHHLVLSTPGAEWLIAEFPAKLRVSVHASERYRTGMMMLDHHLERPAAVSLLKHLQSDELIYIAQHFDTYSLTK